MGLSLDWITGDEQVVQWVFDREDRMKAALEMIYCDETLLLLCSLMCTHFSTVVTLKWDEMDPEEKYRRLTEAKARPDICAHICSIQRNAERYFLHGYPHSATSWHEKCFEETAACRESPGHMYTSEAPTNGRHTTDGHEAHRASHWLSMQRVPAQQEILRDSKACNSHGRSARICFAGQHGRSPKESAKLAQGYLPEPSQVEKGRHKEPLHAGDLEEAVRNADELRESHEWQQSWNDVTEKELVSSSCGRQGQKRLIRLDG